MPQVSQELSREQRYGRVKNAIRPLLVFCWQCGAWIEQIVQKTSGIVGLGSLVLLLVCAFYAGTTHMHGFPKLLAWLPAGGTATVHFVNVIAFFGFVFGAFGLIYTIIQLRLIEARIEGYPDFYRWAKQSFHEFETGRSRELWFMGSTVLPGNVAHGLRGPEDIDAYRTSFIRAMASRSTAGSAATKPFRLLVPHLDEYEHTYDAFKTVRVYGVMDRLPLSDWVSAVDRCRGEAQRFQEQIRTRESAAQLLLEVSLTAEVRTTLTREDAAQRWPIDTRSVDYTSVQFQVLRHGYLLCTDRRATYVMPIHYTKALGDQKGDAVVVPHLVGFTTTNGAIVGGLRQLFEEVWEGVRPENADLDLFYSRHLKDREVQQLWDETKNDLVSATSLDFPSIVSRFDQVDHDHFLGSVATERCVQHLNGIPENAKILDLGGGLGGPARYMASRHKANVTVVDVNANRVRLGDEIYKELLGAARKFNDWGKVTFLQQDLDDLDLAGLTKDGQFDIVVSFLAILHCVEKRRVLRRLPSALKDGGQFVITDFIAGPDLNRDTAQKLREIACPGLISREEYLANLNLGDGFVRGFKIVTDEWKTDADRRYQRICDPSNKNELVAKFGEKAVNDATQLYGVVTELFKERAVEGIEIWGYKV